MFLLPATLCALASFACVWLVQGIALGTRDWFSVITTQLAGNAFNRITPGGGATGTALQANMLADAGFGVAHAATALTVQSVLSTASIVALPVFALPFIVAGTQVPSGLLQSFWIGIPVFLLMSAIGISMFVADAPLRGLGKAVNWVRRVLAPVDRRHPRRPAARGSRPHPARDRSPLAARAGRVDCALAVRVRRAPVDALRAVGRSRPRAGAARVRRRVGAGADPVHTGRARLRRSGARGDARGGGDLDRRRAGRHAGLPAAHLLAADPARWDRGVAVPPSPPAHDRLAPVARLCSLRPGRRDGQSPLSPRRPPTSSRRGGGCWWPTSRGPQG